MQPFERGIIRCHAEVLQIGNRSHPLLGHILLSQHNGEFLCAVVAEVDEYHDVALFDAAVNIGVDKRFHKLVGVLVLLSVGIVAILHALNHVVNLFADAVNQLVVSNLDTIPTLVAVHCIETADDARNGGSVLLANLSQLPYEALAALGVGVAPVHKTMNVGVLQSINFGYLDEFEQMVDARMNSAITAQAHQVQALACLLGITVGALDLGVLQNRVVAAGTVDLNQVLIDHATRTNVEVTHL